LNDASKIPRIVLDQGLELDSLNDASKGYEKEFKCKVEVRASENSKEPKAKNALPGKAAILVE